MERHVIKCFCLSCWRTYNETRSSFFRFNDLKLFIRIMYWVYGPELHVSFAIYVADKKSSNLLNPTDEAKDRKEKVIKKHRILDEICKENDGKRTSFNRNELLAKAALDSIASFWWISHYSAKNARIIFSIPAKRDMHVSKMKMKCRYLAQHWVPYVWKRSMTALCILVFQLLKK